jgi:hypothetical protein
VAFAFPLQAGPSVVDKLEVDHDVFGDGSVILIATRAIHTAINHY